MKVLKSLYKAPKGLIRIKIFVEGERVKEVRVTGDFFFYPEEKISLLERHLKKIGLKGDLKSIERSIHDFFIKEKIETPNVDPTHFAEAFYLALKQLKQ